MAEKNVQQERFVITLTDHAPVRIAKDNWPILSSAQSTREYVDYEEYDDSVVGETPEQGQITTRLIVRKHSDGRVIVYWVKDDTIKGTCRGGQFLENGADIAKAIKQTGNAANISDSLIQTCIAGLPAVDLD